MNEIATKIWIAARDNSELSNMVKKFVFLQCKNIPGGKYEVVQLDDGTRIEYHCVSTDDTGLPEHIRVFVDGKLKFDLVK